MCSCGFLSQRSGSLALMQHICQQYNVSRHQYEHHSRSMRKLLVIVVNSRAVILARKILDIRKSIYLQYFLPLFSPSSHLRILSKKKERQKVHKIITNLCEATAAEAIKAISKVWLYFCAFWYKYSYLPSIHH